MPTFNVIIGLGLLKCRYFVGEGLSKVKKTVAEFFSTMGTP